MSREGFKAWRLSYTHGGERQRPSIGEFPEMSLAEATASQGSRNPLAGIGRAEHKDYGFRTVAESFITLQVAAESKDLGDARNLIRNELISAWGA